MYFQCAISYLSLVVIDMINTFLIRKDISFRKLNSNLSGLKGRLIERKKKCNKKLKKSFHKNQLFFFFSKASFLGNI